ncbi:capsular biosynthesis protein [Niveibacterium sp. SC-1]|uniref:capsule biosynthesis protein n=1 Tax=Niveibacterium sp. SC-1 TaxID=3135646 RepID=UPI00311DCAD9
MDRFLNAEIWRESADRSKRVFLFLQGPCSPFLGRLADRLVAEGHEVRKVNFNAGDVVYWAPRPAANFRDPLEALPDFLDTLYAKQGVTDLVVFGDCRAVHRPAIALARSRGVRTHVFEEGYFRPFWVTLEREGVNAHSLLPRDPDWYREVGQHLPNTRRGEPFVLPFRVRAMHDVAYHAAGALNPVLFPHYRNHQPVNAALQYAGYMRRLPTLRFHERRDNRVTDTLLRERVPYYLLPLQMNGDAQILDHSVFCDMDHVMEEVMASFARHAPGDARLVIKNHPLDYGLDPHARQIARLSRQFGLDGRVHYMETGDLRALAENARGTVTVNSTVGSVAMGHGCPTICLAEAIYDLPGLTFQGSLDAFWREGEAPDAGLFRVFRNTLIHLTQVNGGFFSSGGIELALKNALPRLLASRSPFEEIAHASRIELAGKDRRRAVA